MALDPGTRFGPYEVAEPIGSGGMGEVYRATDTELKRDVAIKILPASFADEPDRLARFQREAEILASLNHANIAQIHGLEKADDQTVIVMELVEGPTLADRIKEGPIAPDEAIGFALQIVSALEAAHDKQIVHRDLKPANVKVRNDGTVKVLDFGISKPIDPAAISGGSPVMTTPAVTQTGVILGTAAYMSPEQARGKFVDQRTDIWAFGCLLFEMLTGQPAFGGEDVMLTLARVLDRDTDLSSIPQTITPAVRHTLKLCLEKDANKRIADIRDVRMALEGKFESEYPADLAAAAAKPFWQRAASLAAALVVVAVIAGTLVWTLKPVPEAEPGTVVRFRHLLPDGQSFTAAPATMLALSPDGTRLAYIADNLLYIRNLNEMESRAVSGPGQGGPPAQPVFSPDGESLVYMDLGPQGNGPYSLKRVPIVGGTPVTVYDGMADPIQDVSWVVSDSLVFSTADGIVRMPSTGGATELIIEAAEDEDFGSPQILPGGEWILFSVSTPGNLGRWNSGQIVAQPLGPGDRKVIWEGGGDARYLPTGHIVYVQEATLFAIRFDLRQMEVVGGPVPIVEGVRRSSNAFSPTGNYTLSDNGTLAYIPGLGVSGTNPDTVLALTDRSGGLELLDVGPAQYRGPRLSPDGTELAVEIIGDNERSAVWIYDLAGRRAFRRLLGAGSNMRPIWTPDGSRVTFATDRDGSWGIYWQPADGSGVAERLTTAEAGVEHWPDSWSADTRTLVFTRIGGTLGSIVSQTIWSVTVDEQGNPGEPQELVPVSAGGAAFSPEGDWFAYRNGDTQVGPANQIHVQPFPPTGAFYAVTEQGGAYPMWSRDGRELFYRRPSTQGATSSALAGVEVTTDGGFAWGDESLLPIDTFVSFFGFRDYDIMPDGERIVMNVAASSPARETSDPVRPQMHLVLNWTQVLLERVPLD